MRFQRLLEHVAKENNTTPKEVENEMQKALPVTFAVEMFVIPSLNSPYM